MSIGQSTNHATFQNGGREALRDCPLGRQTNKYNEVRRHHTPEEANAIEEYRDGDYVVALFHKKAFKARISEISGKCNGQCIHLSARFTIDKNPPNDTIFHINMKLNYIFMMSCFIFLPNFLLMFLTALSV